MRRTTAVTHDGSRERPRQADAAPAILAPMASGRLEAEWERRRSRSVALAGAQQAPWSGIVHNIFWLIGVVVVVLAVLGFLGLR